MNTGIHYVNTITIACWFVDCLANVDFIQFVDFDILPTSILSGFRGLCGFRFLGRPQSERSWIEIKSSERSFAAASRFLPSQDCQDMEHVASISWRLQP